MSKIKLVSIAMSHYCEKVRWALDLKKLEYEEEFHLPIFQVGAARKVAGGRTVPAMISGDKRLGDSTDILKHLDELKPEPRLYPEDPEARKKVEELEELCDETLGPHVRRAAIYHVLKNKALYLQTLKPHAPWLQHMLFRWAFFMIKPTFHKLFRMTPDSVNRSWAKIDGVFDTIEKQLEEPGEFLVGDSLTAADLAFAALAGPIVVPDEYFIPLPAADDLGSEASQRIYGYQERAGGKYVLRLFKEHRKPA